MNDVWIIQTEATLRECVGVKQITSKHMRINLFEFVHICSRISETKSDTFMCGVNGNENELS